MLRQPADMPMREPAITPMRVPGSGQITLPDPSVNSGNFPMRFASNIKDAAIGFIPGLTMIGGAIANDAIYAASLGNYGDEFLLDDLTKTIGKGIWESPVYGGAIRTNPFDVILDTITSGPKAALSEQWSDAKDAYAAAWENPGFAAFDASIVFPAMGGVKKTAELTRDPRMLGSVGYKQLDLDGMGVTPQSWFDSGPAPRHPASTLKFVDGSTSPAKLWGGTHRAIQSPVFANDGTAWVRQGYRTPKPRFWEGVQAQIADDAAKVGRRDERLGQLADIMQGMDEPGVAAARASVRAARSHNPLAAKIGDKFFDTLEKHVPDNMYLAGAGRRWSRKASRSFNTQQVAIDERASKRAALYKEIRDQLQRDHPDAELEILNERASTVAGIIAHVRRATGQDISASEFLRKVQDYGGLNHEPITLQAGDQRTVGQFLEETGWEIFDPNEDTGKRLGGLSKDKPIRERTISEILRGQAARWDARAKEKYGMTMAELPESTRKSIEDNYSLRTFEVVQKSWKEIAEQEQAQRMLQVPERMLQDIAESGAKITPNAENTSVDISKWFDKSPQAVQAWQQLAQKGIDAPTQLPFGVQYRFFDPETSSYKMMPTGQYALEGVVGAWTKAMPVPDDRPTRALIRAYTDPDGDGIVRFANEGDMPHSRLANESESVRKRREQMYETDEYLQLANLLFRALRTGSDKYSHALISLANKLLGRGVITRNSLQRMRDASEDYRSSAANHVPSLDAHLHELKSELNSYVSILDDVSKGARPVSRVETPRAIMLVRAFTGQATRQMFNAYRALLDEHGAIIKSDEMETFANIILEFENVVANKYLEGRTLGEDAATAIESALAQASRVMSESARRHGGNEISPPVVAARMIESMIERGQIRRDLERVAGRENAFHHRLLSDYSGSYASRLFHVFERLVDGDPEFDDMLNAGRAVRNIDDPQEYAKFGTEKNLLLLEQELPESLAFSSFNEKFFRAELKTLLGKHGEVIANRISSRVADAVRDTKERYTTLDSPDSTVDDLGWFDFSEHPTDSLALMHFNRVAHSQLTSDSGIISRAANEVAGKNYRQLMDEHLLWHDRVKLRRSEPGVPERTSNGSLTPEERGLAESYAAFERVRHKALAMLDEEVSLFSTALEDYLSRIKHLYDVQTKSRLESANRSGIRKAAREHLNKHGYDVPFRVSEHLAGPKDRRGFRTYIPSLYGGGDSTAKAQTRLAVDLQPRERRKKWQPELDENGEVPNPDADYVQGWMELLHYYGDDVARIEQDQNIVEKILELQEDMAKDSYNAVLFNRGETPEAIEKADKNNLRAQRWYYGSLDDSKLPSDAIPNMRFLPIKSIDPEAPQSGKKRSKIEISRTEGTSRTPKEVELANGPAIVVDGNVIRAGHRVDFDAMFDDFANQRRGVAVRAWANNAAGYGARVSLASYNDYEKEGLASLDIDSDAPLLALREGSEGVQTLLHAIDEISRVSNVLSVNGPKGISRLLFRATEETGMPEILDSVHRASHAHRKLHEEGSDGVSSHDRVSQRAQEQAKREAGGKPIDPQHDPEVILVPRQMYRSMLSQVESFDHVIMQVLKAPLELWKTTVLQLRAASWIRNSAFGSALLFAISGNPIASIRALKTLYKGGLTRKINEARQRRVKESERLVEVEQEVQAITYTESVVDEVVDTVIEEAQYRFQPTGWTAVATGNKPIAQTQPRIASETTRLDADPWVSRNEAIYKSLLDETAEAVRILDKGSERARDSQLPWLADDVEDNFFTWPIFGMGKVEIISEHAGISRRAESLLAKLSQQMNLKPSESLVVIRGKSPGYEKRVVKHAEESRSPQMIARSAKANAWKPGQRDSVHDAVNRMITMQSGDSSAKVSVMSIHELRAFIDGEVRDISTLGRQVTIGKESVNLDIEMLDALKNQVPTRDGLSVYAVAFFKSKIKKGGWELHVFKKTATDASQAVVLKTIDGPDGFELDAVERVVHTTINDTDNYYIGTVATAKDLGGRSVQVNTISPSDAASGAAGIGKEPSSAAKKITWDMVLSKPRRVREVAREYAVYEPQRVTKIVKKIESKPTEKLTPEERIVQLIHEKFSDTVTDSGGARGMASMRNLEQKRKGGWLDRKLVPYYEFTNAIASFAAVVADTPWRSAHAIRTMLMLLDEQKAAMRSVGIEPPDDMLIIEDMAGDPRIRLRIAEETLGDMVDFSDMSKKERELIANLYPFWSWMKGSTKSYLRNLSNRPAGAMAAHEVGQLGAIGSNEEFLNAPEYMRSYVNIGGHHFSTTGMSPQETPPQLLSAGLGILPLIGSNRRQYGSDSIFGGLNPFIAAGIEEVTGTDMFIGSRLPMDRNVGTGIAGSVLNIPPVDFARDMVVGPNYGRVGVRHSPSDKTRFTSFLNYWGIPYKDVNRGGMIYRGNDESRELWGNRAALSARRESIPGA